MALIEINKNPSKGDLRFFGVVFPIFFGIIGGVVLGLTDSLNIATVIWAVAGVIPLLFFAVKPLRVPIYLGWIYLALPIGWTVSHVLMLAVFYLLFTPTGMVMKLIGRDALKRSIDRSAETYFVKHEPVATARYFKQF